LEPANSRSFREAGITVLAISDPEFLPRLYRLANSLSRNFPSAVLHACLVNVTSERDIERLKQIHPRCEVSLVKEELNDREIKVGMDGITRFTEKAGFCVNLRATAIHRLLLEGREFVLFMDADCIVRKSLSHFPEMLAHSDILIHQRPGMPDYMRVCAAIIAVKRTAASLRFFEKFIARINQIGNRLFFADQLAFHQLASGPEPGITVSHLPSEYIDWEFQPGSFIWTGKGQRKFTNSTYLREEQLYNVSFHGDNACRT
jgi:hypothetical protein